MSTYAYATQMSSQRPVVMVLALVYAAILSPLHTTRTNDTHYDIRWNSGFVLPVVLAGLIIAIKTTSSPTASMLSGPRRSILSSYPSLVFRVGGSSWGLAGVLVMLMFVLSWQDSAQHFLWK